MMSCRVSCDNGMTSQLNSWNGASNDKNVMWWRLFSYYYTHMIQGGQSGRFLPALNTGDEKR